MAPTCDSPSLKIATAMALIRFKRLHQLSSSSSDSDSQRWKRKAKERKRELLRLREELKQLEDGTRCEADPLIASCRCHFFDGLGERGPGLGDDGGDHWIDEVLRRRFLRLVRWKERRRRPDGSLQRRHFLEFNSENEIERFSTAIDFLVELSDSVVSKGELESSFSTFSHQAIDFIFASLRNLLQSQKESELIEEIVNGLIMRLTKRMCAMPKNGGSIDSSSDAQFYVQHLICKLGNEPFIGHRIILAVSQSVSIVAESLLFMDPFDNSFPCTNGNMFMMIQLMEFLISDYMKIWMSREDFDTRLLEEWSRSVLLARKALEPLECRNGLYVLYLERVIGELSKQVHPLVREGKLDVDILPMLFC